MTTLRQARGGRGHTQSVPEPDRLPPKDPAWTRKMLLAKAAANKTRRDALSVRKFSWEQ